MVNFGEVLSRAWNIIWNNKVLWIFGVLAALVASGDNDFNPQFNYRVDMPPGMERTLENLSPLLVIVLLSVILAGIVILIVLSTLGRAGLIRGAWLADGGDQSFNFSRLFNESLPYFWRVLLLGLLMFAVGLSLILILVFPALLTFGIALICLWPLFCLLIPAFWALALLFKLATIAVIGEDLGVMDALRRAWEIARAHISELVVMAIILAIGAALVNFLAGLPMLVVAAPLLSSVISGSRALFNGGILLSGILFLLYLPIFLAVRGILESYVDTVWTILFRRFSS
ncbi:MAG: hypothetical protein GX491_17025 [Chloroflexi bacterium]|nr:hypothetical protein [Chloroflexota bacterium]